MHDILTLSTSLSGSRKKASFVRLNAHERYGRVEMHQLVNKGMETFGHKITFEKRNTASVIGVHCINVQKNLFLHVWKKERTALHNNETDLKMLHLKTTEAQCRCETSYIHTREHGKSN